MARRTTLALGLAVAVLSGGCGTIHNVKQPTLAPPGNPDAKVCCIYGGVRGDWAVMSELSWENRPSYLDYVVIPAMCIFDLVCTSVGDTVTLPYTVGSEVKRVLYRPEQPLQVGTPGSAQSAPVSQPETTEDQGRIPGLR